MQNLQSALGVVAMLGFAFALSENHRAVAWKKAGIGLAATIVYGRHPPEGSASRDCLCSYQ